MSRVEKFEALRPLAGPCLLDYTAQVDRRAGVRYPFDFMPMEQGMLVRGLHKHIQNPNAFQNNVITFGRLTERLGQFGPYAVRATLWTPEDPKAEVTLEIPPATLESYQKFGAALTHYSKVLREASPGDHPSAELIDAAVAACKIARPNEWDPDKDDPNFDVETQVRPAGHYSNTIQQQIIPDYLDAVMADAPLAAAS